jgi:hypothetical protein
MYNQKEEIKIKDDVYLNRTAMYLLPLMKAYGDEFLKNFSKVISTPKAFGIDDYKGPHYDNALYALFKPNEHFLTIEKIRNHEAYLDDYVFSDPKYQVLVVRLPREVIVNFLEGNYSKIINKVEIEKFYKKKVRKNGKENYTKVYSVVKKLPHQRQAFINEVWEDFKSNIEGSVIEEYDYPPILSQEIFNYDKKRDLS